MKRQNKLEYLPLASLSSLLLGGRLEPDRVLHLRACTWPYLQMLDQAGNACKVQTLQLIWPLSVTKKKKL